MAELLCRPMEYAVSTEVLQVPEKDLVASTTSTFPAGPNDMGATEPVSRTVLAETENSTRLAGKTIYRHARRCNPREEPDALVRTSGSVRGPGKPGSLPRCLVPSEHSSGNRTNRGSITKTGNVHVRKAIIRAAWKYTRSPRCSRQLKERQQVVSAEVIAVAWKAQHRLYKRFHRLAQTKPRCVANTAIARELVGFLWAALQLENPLSTTHVQA